MTVRDRHLSLSLLDSKLLPLNEPFGQETRLKELSEPCS